MKSRFYWVTTSSILSLLYLAPKWCCYTNHGPAYVTSAFLSVVQMQTEKKPLKVCSSRGSSPVVVPLRESSELFGLKAPIVGVVYNMDSMLS